ncbi:MAG: BamA/TamA family outer membrane protein [Calditrichia bacterium]|nr:BamA/TamA family outer membrane protein [Calditrichia bacterium]
MKLTINNKSVKYILLFVIITTGLYAEDPLQQNIFIKSMKISGLKHTNRSIVLRELTFNIPSLVPENKIEEFKTRLTNLIIFKHVQTNYTDSILSVNIEEAPRFSVFPSFILIDRSWSKINYGFDFTHFNLFGDKIYLNLNTALGYNPGFSFSIIDDWFSSKRIILGFKAYSGKIRHKLYPFEEKHQNIAILTGRRINRDMYFTINNGIHFFSFPQSELEFFNKENYFSKLYQFGFSLLYDKRNYRFFPTEGHFFNASFNSESINPFELQFKHYLTDLRVFLPYKKVTFSLRQFFHITGQNLPIYDGVFLGYTERLRGYFFNSYYGKALLINHVEMRFPLLTPKYYSFKSFAQSSPDIFKQHFSNMYFGIYGGIFADNGMIKDHFRSFNIKDSLTGYGFSLYFLFPYHNLMRFDLAINDEGKFEYILEGRVSF